MKTKKALKLIKEILVLANELQEKQDSKIPDYKKVSPNLENVIIANKGVDTNGIYAQWSKAIKEALAKKDMSKTPFDDLYNKSKEKSMPFAHPLSEEPSEEYRKDHFYNLRSIFSEYTQEEIKKDPVLKMKAKLCLVEAIVQLDLL